MLLLNGKHINVFARKDGGPTEMKSENMRVSINSDEFDMVNIRITDVANPEFYINLSFHVSNLEGLENHKPDG